MNELGCFAISRHLGDLLVMGNLLSFALGVPAVNELLERFAGSSIASESLENWQACL